MCSVVTGEPTDSSVGVQFWSVWQALFVQNKHCGFGHRFRIEPSNSNIPQHVLTSNASLHPHPMRTWCIRAHEYFTCHGSLVEIRGVFDNGVWSHYHFDKQNMNCRNTDTFSHNETQTRLSCCKCGCDVTMFGIRFHHLCVNHGTQNPREGLPGNGTKNADKLTESRCAWWRHVMCNAPVFFTVFQLYTVTTCIL